MAHGFAAFVLTGVLLMHATGLTLAVHLHACDEDHDARHCSACQMLAARVQVPPSQPEAPLFEMPASEPATCPDDRVHYAEHDDTPQIPRAPPRA